MDTDVLVVGAGPVGLTLAMDLATRGVNVTVLEIRRHGEPPSVKCNHVAARSMEIFRRLGVSKQVREAGLPPDYPHDIAFRTTMTGREITRIPIPSRSRRYTDTTGADAGWPTPEPPHRINQIFLEPILVEHACEIHQIRMINRTELLHFDQHEHGVVATVRNLDTDELSTIDAQYLVGCDGARSRVRHVIGARLEGDAVVQRVQSSHIRAPDLLSRLSNDPAWGNISLNPRRSGTVYAIDGEETWLVHNYLRDDEPDFDSVNRDWAIRTILGVGQDFCYDVISREDWFGRRLVANRFRDRRAFICGDAAHLWVPYAGYGMNAGIADAQNLSWLLAARINGWGGDGILDAYECERLPITEQVSYFAMNHAHAMAKQRRAVPKAIEDDSAEGDAARAELGKATYELNVQQYAAAGLNFGYYYDNSPIIVYDAAAHPEYSMGAFTASTVPGCRLPHLWLSDGRSLYDALGPEYTLVRLDSSIDTAVLSEACDASRLPLMILDIDIPAGESPYQSSLVLVRPDQHIAWRGDHVPSDVTGLIATIRGGSPAT